MSSSVLRLYYLLNHTAAIDFANPWVALDNLSPPTLLIIQPELARSILKAKEVRTFDLTRYWQKVTQTSDAEIPTLNAHFSQSAVLAHGNTHRITRQRLMPIYSAVEQDLLTWIDPVTKDFFIESNAGAQPMSPLQFVESYVALILRRILCRYFDLKEAEFPQLPHRLFSFFLRKDELLAYETSLRILHQWLKQTSRCDDQLAHDLLSITVMGKEPMIGALCYGLCNRTNTDGLPWTALSLMETSSPVSELIAREVLADAVIQDLALTAGQILHISPHILDIYESKRTGEIQEPRNAYPSLPFGFGPHVCLGRGIALAIAKAFIENLTQISELRFKDISFFRDNVLTPRKKQHESTRP